MDYSIRRMIYEGLPAFLKAPAGWVPFAWLAGPAYRAVLRRGARFDRAGRDEILAYQEKALGEMLAFVVREVPAYEALRGPVGRLQPFEALKGFPLIDKDALQADFARYVPRSIAAIPHYEATTGGTSGRQSRFYLDDVSQSVEMAFMHRQWARVGYHPRCRKATFRGVPFRKLPPGGFWQANPVYNELQFSPFHMHAGTLDLYTAKLMEYRPHYLHGYPSSIATLARHVVQNGIAADRFDLRGVLLGSEPVYADQREIIERAFGARAFSWYGHSERVVLGGECEQATAYHHFPDYGILELVAENGQELTEPGGRGEIVGTGLLNRSLPLIRYRSGDWARKLEPRCACGRSFDRFDEVDAWRKQQSVIGRSGARMSLAALNIHGTAFDRVVRHQYYQDKPGVMDVRVVVRDGFGDADRAAIERAFQSRTGDELKVNIVVADSLELTARGKLQRLVQRLPEESP